jgi:hypothetical protein
MRAFTAGVTIYQSPTCLYRFRLHHGSLTVDPDLSASVAIRLEHLEICRRILSSPHKPATLRRLCRRWCAKEAALLLYFSGMGSYQASVSRVLRETLAVSPRWPIELPAEFLAFAARRLKRWTRSSLYRLESVGR